MRQKPGPKPLYGSPATAQLNISLPPQYLKLLEQQAAAAGYVGKGSAVEYARNILLDTMLAQERTSSQGAADPYAPKT